MHAALVTEYFYTVVKKKKKVTSFTTTEKKLGPLRAPWPHVKKTHESTLCMMSFHDRVVTMLITQVVKENWVKHCRDLSVIFVLKQPILRYVSGIKPGDTDEELLRD